MNDPSPLSAADIIGLALIMPADHPDMPAPVAHARQTLSQALNPPAPGDRTPRRPMAEDPAPPQ